MDSKNLIYIVDDDKNVRRSLQVGLENAGYAVQVFQDPITAFQAIKAQSPDLALFDVRMGEVSGIDLFRKLLNDGLEVPTIFMSGHASMTEAVAAVQMGAFDFLEKPFATEKLVITIERCLELQRIRAQVRDLQSKTETTEFIGSSAAFRSLRSEIEKVAATHSPVLITGESGTGKELIAREIHQLSRSAKGPFVKVNCAAIPENLIESELFGYQKGAFTGADRNKKGFFEQAHEGTIFLDEIGEMSLSAQAKVLRTLQSFEIHKLGSEQTQKVRVRVVAATNRNLDAAVVEKTFREDLLYRINVFPIHAPPLRERRTDIPQLVSHFLREYTRINSLPTKHVTPEALEKLSALPWPGNIRELKNKIERMAILGGQVLDKNLIPESASSLANKTQSEFTNEEPESLKNHRRRLERQHIIHVLRTTDGNISEAAMKLDVERTYLHKKLLQYEIKKKDFFS